jgi:hypothetical protein
MLSEAKHLLFFIESKQKADPSVGAGINRQEAEDERSSRERSSDPLGPEFCAEHREVHSEA